MPQKEKTFVRRTVESLALKLIVFVTSLVGVSVLAWYTANSAWFHGMPGYKVGLIVAGLFALCAIGVYFLILTIARIPLRNAPAGSLLEPREHWLLELAETDKLELHTGVFVVECDVRELLEGENPHVFFNLNIRNGTVYAITIDPETKGFISLNNTPLRGERVVSSAPRNLPHGCVDDLEIRQELKSSDIAKLAELETAMRGQGVYDFGDLHITLRGNSPSGEAMPARLQFRRVTRRRLKNGFELI
ncbi:MAG TPA: hypothetical protein VJ023_01430 [Pyrinomonadaceae bacterium]|nr:hypothetical protein [Pyrinomonadaceae bacterium]